MSYGLRVLVGRLLAVALTVACASEPSSSMPDATASSNDGVVAIDAPPDLVAPRVQAALDELASELAVRSPGTELAVAFEDLQTGTRLHLDGDVHHVSASSAKAWWVAAALDASTIANVQDDAVPVFETSDNSAAGRIIDVIGPDAVNVWMWDVAGMTSSALTQWSYDRTRVASNSPRAMGGDNYMTANDAVTLLRRVYRREILVDDRGQQLLAWMTLSPNSGIGGWLAERLPEAARDAAMHKAGYLPPGCCGDDGYYNTANEIGIVSAPDGRAYAIAILARRGGDYYGAQLPLGAYASCRVYRAFVDDAALACE